MLSVLAIAVLSPKLDAVLDVPELKGAVYSAFVSSLNGAVLYERNADLRVMPASNQKLIACAYALHELGGNYVPRTRIWKERDRIVVDATGDPSLTYKQLTDAKKALKLTGKLPVYVKQAYRVGIPESWELDDLPNRYASPVSAFCFDQAAFELWAEKGRAFLLPANFGVRITFDPSLGAGASRYDPIRKTVRVGRGLPAKRTPGHAGPTYRRRVRRPNSRKPVLLHQDGSQPQCRPHHKGAAVAGNPQDVLGEERQHHGRKPVADGSGQAGRHLGKTVCAGANSGHEVSYRDRWNTA